MKVFESKHKAKEWFLNYQTIDVDNLPKMMYHDEIEYKPKMGDWLLFRHLKPVGNYMILADNTSDGILISRPILGMFIEWDVWDQALVIRYIQPFRLWQLKSKYKFEGTDKIHECRFSQLDIEDIQFWTGDINIIGQWEHRPNYSEIKKALTK